MSVVVQVGTKTVDIIMYRGQDLDIDVVLDPVIDITGKAIAFTMQRDYIVNLNPVEVSKTVGSGIVITNGPSATFTISLASADTAHLPFGKHVYDVQDVDDPPRDPWLIGTITLLDLVNRAP